MLLVFRQDFRLMLPHFMNVGRIQILNFNELSKKCGWFMRSVAELHKERICPHKS